MNWRKLKKLWKRRHAPKTPSSDFRHRNGSDKAIRVTQSLIGKHKVVMRETYREEN